MSQLAPPLTGTDLRTGPAVLGTMTFGAQVDEPTARRMVARCLDAGVTMFDTANVYAEGRSEELLGRLLAPVRDEVLIASKVGAQGGERPLSAEAIRREADASLRRLGTDRLDLYYLHKPDRSTPLAESLEAMQQLVAAGKVRHLGQSNHAAWEIAELLHLAGSGPAPRVAQPLYNLLARRAEGEYAHLCAARDLANVVYNPLAGGLLTGKHRGRAGPDPATRFGRATYRERYWNDEQLRAVDELGAIAADAGWTLVELSLRWLRSRPLVRSILLGASRLEQLEEDLRALDGPAPDDATCRRADEVWQRLRGAAPDYHR